MAAEDDALARIVAEEEAAEAAARARGARRRRIGCAVAAVISLVAASGCVVWALWSDSQRGQTLTVIGRADGTVLVDVEGEPTREVPARGGFTFRPSRPGSLRFRFTDAEGRSFEQVYDVPRKHDDAARAIPSEEDRCWALFDLETWYSQAVSISELLRLREEEAERRRAGQSIERTLPPPRLVRRIRPLDPLPTGGYTRNFYFHPTLREGASTLTLVDVTCSELQLDGGALTALALARHTGALEE